MRIAEGHPLTSAGGRGRQPLLWLLHLQRVDSSGGLSGVVLPSVAPGLGQTFPIDSLFLLSAKHVFVSNNTVFGERQAPS